ncbi:MAG: potassium transporter Kup [Rhodothermales bacterium]
MAEHSNSTKAEGRYLAALSLAALGVVYGDIGTSPLYAFRESFRASYGIDASADNVLGVLSLIFWSLVIVISVKYLVFVMRADNQGEGGIMALTALVAPRRSTSRRRNLLVLLGLFGAALLYGDSMITPAISVLSAVEGLEVATPFFRPYVIPITIGILFALFAIQRRGTSGIGKVFGPVTLLWFSVLAFLGIVSIFREPYVLAALNPIRGVDFFVRNGGRGFLVLGSVFLVVTGGEALYADMGHFGVRPIRLTWFAVVLPALLLNYFGQGALILSNPAAVENPFFLMAPGWALYPIVVLATAATVIASQAVISGAFSLTRQAVRLGYMPRMGILQTSTKEIGQIYIPVINWTLMVACIGLVLGFRSSSNLAAAYGVGVTTDMVFTTILFAVVARAVWKWKMAAAAGLAAVFLVADLSFWGANLPKIPDGGWFPLVIAGIVFGLMTTWKKGRVILSKRLNEQRLPLEDFIGDINRKKISRVPGTAVFMYGNPHGTPPALMNNLKHNKVLHKQVVILRVETEDIPRIPPSERVEVEALDNGFYRLTMRYGFAEDPNIPEVLSRVKTDGLRFEPMETSYFLGRERILATDLKGMAIWRERLFAMMSRNARSATAYFHIPPNRVVEFGAQVEI